MIIAVRMFFLYCQKLFIEREAVNSQKLRMMIPDKCMMNVDVILAETRSPCANLDKFFNHKSPSTPPPRHSHVRLLRRSHFWIR